MKKSEPITLLPSHALALVDPASRKHVKGLTEQEAGERYAKRSETIERKQFEQWLKLNGLVWVGARTDKKSTIKVGWPDFSIFWDAKSLFGDFKSTGKTLTQDQEEVKEDLERSGFTVHVWYSADQAIRDAKKFFQLKYVR